MKQKSIQFLLIVALAGTILSAQGFNGLFQTIKKTINQSKKLQNSPKSPIFGLFTGKSHTQARFDPLMQKAQNGDLISQADINEYKKSAKLTNHYILNQADEKNGHTLLYYLAKHTNKLKKRLLLINKLMIDGARFNNRDTYIMGPEKTLKVLLGISGDASEKELQKILRTFYTKNSPDKLNTKLQARKLTQAQVDKQLSKLAEIDRAVQMCYYSQRNNE